jgi:hypothetical protein
MRYSNRWEMPEVTFYEVEDHGFTGEHEGRPLYAYGKPNDMDDRGMPKTGEFYNSLDRALIAWVGEKYTGPRGAGGTGVGTAADWFARMIGMDTFTPISISYQDRNKVMVEVLAATTQHNGPTWRRAHAIGDELEARGLMIAKRDSSH